jgi:hypothetical protein
LFEQWNPYQKKKSNPSKTKSISESIQNEIKNYSTNQKAPLSLFHFRFY